MHVFRPQTYRSDDGLSLLEVVVSMVILSIVTAFVASLVAGSLRVITRTSATSTAALIAEEQLDQLLSVPIKQWGYRDEKTLKESLPPVTVNGNDNNTYTVKRELSRLTSDLDLRDSCQSVVGSRTSSADLVKLTIKVSANTGTYKDEYVTSTYVARDGNATFLKSTVTVKFNVVRAGKKTPYREGVDGNPIHVHIEDKYRGNDSRSRTEKHDGKTKGGCVTFLELNGKSPEISFDLGEYRMSSDDTSSYKAKINMISGGHRELVFDIARTSKIKVIPDMVGVAQKRCDGPRLIRMHTPIAAPKNRAVVTLQEIAKVSETEANRIRAINENNRSDADKARLASYERYQYYLVCQGSDRKFTGNDFRFWYLLPDTIPISVVENNDVRAIGKWSDSQFNPIRGVPLLEEGDWPTLLIDNPKVGGEQQGIFVGSCIMNKTNALARPHTLTKEELNAAMRSTKNVHVPLWTIPLEGWYKAKHLDPNYKGYLPLVLKGINDSKPTPGMWGDSRIAGLNQDWYAGCKDTPVFDAGWMQDVDLRNNFQQMRLAMPFGLYAYSIYNPRETEDVDGKTVTKSRNTCSPQKRNDNYAGDRACIASGASRVTFFQNDVRAPYRPSWWGGGENIYKNRYYDWFDPERLSYPLPRGPILDACEANTGDFRYCPGGPGLDPRDTNYYDFGDHNHPSGTVPGYGAGRTEPPSAGGSSGGNTGGGNTGASKKIQRDKDGCFIIDEFGNRVPKPCLDADGTVGVPNMLPYDQWPNQGEGGINCWLNVRGVFYYICDANRKPIPNAETLIKRWLDSKGAGSGSGNPGGDSGSGNPGGGSGSGNPGGGSGQTSGPPWPFEGSHCIEKVGKKKYVNHCTGRSGRYFNGDGNTRKPQRGTWEDSDQCWMESPYDDDDGYNYCTDWFQKDRYDD